MPLVATATFLEYSDAEHRYFTNGKEMPSVTQILDAAGLISPFCRDEEARYRGSKVHEFCAVDDVTRLDFRKVPVDLRGYLRAWRRYRLDTGFTPHLIEHRVDCSNYGYAGRFDRFGVIPGKALPVLLDIKTSKTGAIAGYVRLQLAAYSLAFSANKVFYRTAVSLMPNGRYSSMTYPVATHSSDRAEWLQILRQTQEKTNGHRNN